MIVPQFWAESRLQHREKGKQVTVRRFGWSDSSQADAQSNADARVREALARVLAGEKLRRRDLKVAYNGSAGVPIREEVVSRHGETVISRNSYGARCLNTPNVLFADIDFPDRVPSWFFFAVFAALILLAVAVARLTDSWGAGVASAVFALFVAGMAADAAYRAFRVAKGGRGTNCAKAHRPVSHRTP